MNDIHVLRWPPLFYPITLKNLTFFPIPLLIQHVHRVKKKKKKSMLQDTIKTAEQDLTVEFSLNSAYRGTGKMLLDDYIKQL